MKKISYYIVALTLLLTSNFVNITPAYSATATATKSHTVAAPVQTVEAQSLDVVKNPQKYLNKIVIMKATFDKFSTLGLDYKPAMRSSQNYIGFLIKRDDVVDHTIPLSEMKLFMKRELAEKNINLESGDKIQITGKVFSTALGDPWIDVTQIKIIQKSAKKTEK